jgi:hypothetical protein
MAHPQGQREHDHREIQPADQRPNIDAKTCTIQARLAPTCKQP